MIVSIDGPIGSGKTTLTSHLAIHFDGIDFKHSPSGFESVHSSVIELIDQVSGHREALRNLFNTDTYDENYRSQTMLLFNVIRCLLIQSNIDAKKSPYTFIDSFWDPFWHLEPEYFHDFFWVIHESTPLPDISLFLRLDETQSIRRATMRDPVTTHTADASELKQKRRDFISWANENIPNFHVLRADHPSHDVLKQAIKVIEENA